MACAKTPLHGPWKRTPQCPSQNCRERSPASTPGTNYAGLRLTGTIRLTGDRTRPACRFRRPAENIVPPTFPAPSGPGRDGWTKCLAGRQTQQAGGLRSPFQWHHSGLKPTRPSAAGPQPASAGAGFTIPGFVGAIPRTSTSQYSSAACHCRRISDTNRGRPWRR